MEVYDTEEGFAAAVAERLPAGAPARSAVLGGIREGEAEARAAKPLPDPGLNLRLASWVLRDEDMPVLEAISMAAAAATALLAPAAITAAAVIAGVAAFSKLCWSTYRRGAILSRNEIGVLGVLKLHGPIALEELQQKAAAAVAGLTPPTVAASLQSLTNVELRDGSLVALARIDASGRWVAAPV
jgi:hypothetical protein